MPMNRRLLRGGEPVTASRGTFIHGVYGVTCTFNSSRAATHRALFIVIWIWKHVRSPALYTVASAGDAIAHAFEIWTARSYPFASGVAPHTRYGAEFSDGACLFVVHWATMVASNDEAWGEVVEAVETATAPMREESPGILFCSSEFWSSEVAAVSRIDFTSSNSGTVTVWAHGVETKAKTAANIDVDDHTEAGIFLLRTYKSYEDMKLSPLFPTTNDIFSG
mmetsp:Transcript_11997/g.23900  ORF Transcript_11997/g.23900 Transcript_11997/m.23900 type:complete len:222 (-) Transcript_11997:29-694(-)